MRKSKILKPNEIITNSMKQCEFCNNGNCIDIGKRSYLNDFKNVSFCKKTLMTIQYTKMTEDEIRENRKRD